jgi:hypothetical protein
MMVMVLENVSTILGLVAPQRRSPSNADFQDQYLISINFDGIHHGRPPGNHDGGFLHPRGLGFGILEAQPATMDAMVRSRNDCRQWSFVRA